MPIELSADISNSPACIFVAAGFVVAARIAPFLLETVAFVAVVTELLVCCFWVVNAPRTISPVSAFKLMSFVAVISARLRPFCSLKNTPPFVVFAVRFSTFVFIA